MTLQEVLCNGHSLHSLPRSYRLTKLLSVEMRLIYPGRTADL